MRYVFTLKFHNCTRCVEPFQLDNNQKEFLEFVLSKYVEIGIEELGQEKLPDLLKIKYFAINDATELLGGVNRIKATFIGFQQHLFASVES